jgi:predicted enzyme related to lactoylglutathione lyase
VSALVLNITFDCLDARAVAQFWEAVTGYPNELQQQPGNDYWVVGPSDGSLPRLVFVTVPEKRAAKNRVHLDLLPRDSASQEEEVARLVGLGAQVVDDRRDSTPGGWVVMADPEGNEFCIEPEPS